MTTIVSCERPRARPLPLYLPPGAGAILALEPGSCRWPFGEAEADGFHFCAAPAGHHTYCPAHRRLARGRSS